MQKEILIHIGTHKTGTTSIQDFLSTNRDLLSEEGIIFPRTGTLCPRTGHHNIAWEVTQSKRFNKSLGTLDDLLKELTSSNYKLAVLSSERQKAMQSHCFLNSKKGR